MNKAVVNALTIALLDEFEPDDDRAWDLVSARAFATKFAEENEAILVQQVKVAAPVAAGAVGLMAHQQDAIANGVGLCPNCQQPKNNHLPGCARATGEDATATTRAALPPASA